MQLLELNTICSDSLVTTSRLTGYMDVGSTCGNATIIDPLIYLIPNNPNGLTVRTSYAEGSSAGAYSSRVLIGDGTDVIGVQSHFILGQIGFGLNNDSSANDFMADVDFAIEFLVLFYAVLESNNNRLTNNLPGDTSILFAVTVKNSTTVQYWLDGMVFYETSGLSIDFPLSVDISAAGTPSGIDQIEYVLRDGAGESVMLQ